MENVVIVTKTLRLLLLKKKLPVKKQTSPKRKNCRNQLLKGNYVIQDGVDGKKRF